MATVTIVLVVAALLASAVLGGVFYAFSSFVMRALRALPDADGCAAMQSINLAVIAPSFFAFFLGGPIVALAAVAAAAVDDGAGGALGPIIAAGAALIAAFVLTVAVFQPRNLALGALDPASPDAAASWRAYARDWTRLNHLRTALGLAATVLYATALTA